MPVYVGYPEVEFHVEIIVDYEGGETLKFYLESLDLIDKMEGLKKEIFAENLATFGDIVKIEKS